jgi:hypothetical protein
MRHLMHALAICVSVAAVAAAQTKLDYVDAITNIGSTTRVIENVGVKIPVDVDSRHQPAIQPRVRQVTHEGTEKNADAFNAELKKEGDVSFLVVTPANGPVAPGKYTVRVTVPKLLKTPLKEGDPPPPAPLQTIDLTLTRGAVPKSAVVMPSPLKIQRVIRWNGEVWYEPKEWLIRETTGRAPILPNPKEASAHLISQSTSGLGTIRVTFPEVIEAAQQERATVALEGAPACWIGDASATILFRSDSLANPLMAYSVQVHSRYSWFWLFLTIAAGVALGIVTNRVLVPRIASMTARAKAVAERERIMTIQSTFIDPEILAELDRIVATLGDAIRNKRLKGDEVAAIMSNATTEANTVVEHAQAKMKELNDRINAILEAVRHPEAQTGTLRDLSNRTTNRALALHATLRQGHVGSVERELKDLERTLPYDVAVVVPAWKKNIGLPLEIIGRWPGFNVDADLESLQTKLTEVKEPATLTEVGQTLKATEQTVRTLRAGLGLVGFKEIHAFVREAIGDIERAVPQSKELAQLKEAEVTLRAFDDADLPRQLVAGAESVHKARIALERALAAAWRPADNNTQMPGLVESDYKKALKAVRAQAPQPAKEAHLESTAMTDNMEATTAVAPQPPPNPWQFQPPALAASSIRSMDDYASAAAAASWLRDIILAVFVIGGGMLIFMTTYIGTFADFLGALLWGFSVNLGAETVTQYASPLMQRRPFPR